MNTRSLIVVPAYNAESTIARTLESCLAQTAPANIHVVDDVSTDRTGEIVRATSALHPGRIMYQRLKAHEGGPARGRNQGLEMARAGRYEFVMFLDADDEIHPEKIEAQERALDEDKAAGWVFCDVDIIDSARRRRELASAKYKYAQRQLEGDLHEQLSAGNFIPVHAPLVRVGIIPGDFIEKIACEDWDFWTRLAEVAFAAYVPRVLATYHRSLTGRSNSSRRVSIGTPSGMERLARPQDIVEPLRLNLGCGTPGTRSWHPQPGFVNLDKSMGWTYESGLGQFQDRSVAGITISHSLMYVPRSLWRFVFAEFYRVLRHRHEFDEPSGVIRITEDDCYHPQSSRKGGWRGSEPAVSMTSADVVINALHRAGFRTATAVGPRDTSFMDDSLIQQCHGDLPDVFFVEGVKV